MKRKHRNILVRTLVTLIPALILAGTLTYVKLFGFKRALQELVDSRTNGQYSLVIEHSFVNPLTMSFTFNGITIRRNESSSLRGIRQVTIPVIKLRFGSMKSMLMVKQFNIKNLTIDEPVIEFDAPANDIASLRSPAHKLSLPQQLVKLYPAIEALLSNFNIESLMIQRASVGMEKEAVGSSLRLNFIDLLIEHWNIQRLTEKSQLQLKVGAQHLEFAKVSLLFSGVEFNFQKHQLRFSDFKFYSLDSTSQSRIEAMGKSLLLEGLNYKELYEHQRYSIRKAVVENPHINLWINLNKKDATKTKDSSKSKDKDLVTRILRQSFGECSIDSTIIRNASVNTVFQHGSDSVKINLPQLDVRLHGFGVVRDSSNFQVGELEIDLNRTAISLRKNLALHCNRILFDKKRDLTFTDVILYDSIRRKEVATIGKLSLNYFNLLYFVFDQRFYADRVTVENAVIHLSEETLRSRSPTKRSSKIENLDVRHVSLKNVALNYVDKNSRVMIKGLSASLNRLTQNIHGEFVYDFNAISLRNALISHKPEHLEASLTGVRFDGKNLTTEAMHVQKDSLTADVVNWEAQLAGNAFVDQNYENWTSVKFHQLNLSGKLSTHFTAHHGETRRPLHVAISEIKVDQLNLQTTIDKNEIAFTGTDIGLSDAGYRDGKIRYGSIRAYLENITLQMPTVSSDIESLQINYPSNLKFTNTFVSAGNIHVKLPKIFVSSLSQRDNQWACKTITAHFPSFVKDHLDVSTDSVRLSGIKLNEGKAIPVMDHLEAFGPSITLLKRDGPRTLRSKSKENKIDLDGLGRYTIYPGALTLPNKKVIAFGKIDGDHRKNSFVCTSVSMETSKLHWKLYSLKFLQHRVDIDSISIRPNDVWLRNGLEESKITAGLYGVHFNGVSREEITSAAMNDVDVTVDRFSLDVVRDKRLPEGTLKEKPATLAKLLKLPRFIKVNTVTLNHGKLHYTEISEKTGESGVVTLNEISARAKLERKNNGAYFVDLDASTKLYNDGTIDLKYQTIDSSSFTLDVGLKNMDLTKLNRALIPLLALEIKSGYVKQYRMKVTADNERAMGNAVISYKDLHLEIFKKDEPAKRTLRSELITFVADGIILKNSKDNATSIVDQPRIKHKAIFNYWIRSAMQGAMGAIRKGKSKRSA